MEKVPRSTPTPHPEHPEQQRPQPEQQRLQTADGVIVWSPCALNARRWEHRLTPLGRGPVRVIACSEILHETLLAGPRDKSQSELRLILVDCSQLVPPAAACATQALSEEAWSALRLHHAVAVMPHLTWKEAALWLLCGARAVIAWQSSDDEVRAALDAARSAPLPQLHDLLQRTLDGGSGTHSGPHSGTNRSAKAQLSPREREVLPLLCQGLSNAEIGRCLFVSEDDVRHHLKNLYRKLGTHNRLQVLLIALSNDWVGLQELLENRA